MQVDLTQSERFMKMADKFCAKELQRSDIRAQCGSDTDKRGYKLACLLEFQRNISTES